MTRSSTAYYRNDYLWRERRVRNNRIRRRREMRKNFLLFVLTVCLIITCSIAFNGFRSNAKTDAGKTPCKYYKTITINNDDTLWSIAETYMDAEHYDSVASYIKEVKKMNALPNDDIHYGEHIVIPYYTYEQ